MHQQVNEGQVLSSPKIPTNDVNVWSLNRARNLTNKSTVCPLLCLSCEWETCFTNRRDKHTMNFVSEQIVCVFVCE